MFSSSKVRPLILLWCTLKQKKKTLNIEQMAGHLEETTLLVYLLGDFGLISELCSVRFN